MRKNCGSWRPTAALFVTIARSQCENVKCGIRCERRLGQPSSHRKARSFASKYPVAWHVVFRCGSEQPCFLVFPGCSVFFLGGTTMRTLRYGMLALFALMLVLGTAGLGLADETQGKFKNALADKKSFVVTEQDKDHTYQLGATAKILINDRESTLSDLK